MPFSNTLRTVPIHTITVLRDERQRREINTEGLEQSIRQNGLINPIVVSESNDGSLTLLAGERRLQACRNLGWAEVSIRLATDLSPIEAQIIELEENAKREDLDWKDLVRAVHRIHSLHTQIDPTWTQEQTAEAISQSPGNLSLLLAIFPYLTLTIRTKPISSCTSYREAYNIIKTDKERKQAALFSDLISDLGPTPTISIHGNGNLGDPPPDSQFKALAPVSPRRLALEETILSTSFLDWAPTYTGPKFTVLHIDFPYGQTERGPQQIIYEPDIYEDSPQIYIDLLDCFCTHLDRFFSLIGWIMFWYSERMGEYTRKTISTRCPSLSIQTHPLIWVHSDNVGISADSRRRPRHIYDTCLLMSRGDIPIAQIVSDAYSSPTDRSIHPHCKPVPMLKHFFRMLIDDQTDLLDPTCGSAASLRAAEELGARSVLGLETNPDYRESAIQSLTNSRHFQSIESP